MPHFNPTFYLVAYPRPKSATQANAPGAGAPPDTALIVAANSQNEVYMAGYPGQANSDALWQFVPLFAPQHQYVGVGIQHVKTRSFLAYGMDPHQPKDGYKVVLYGIAEPRTGWHINPPKLVRDGISYFPVIGGFDYYSSDVHYDLTIYGGGPWSRKDPVITWGWRDQENQIWGILPIS